MNKTTYTKIQKGINQISFFLLAIFLTMLFLWLILIGNDKYDGNEIFKVFFYDSFNNTNQLKEILLLFSPLLIGSLAVFFCLRVGAINLGISGQMSLAALSIYFAHYFLQKTGVFSQSNQFLFIPILFLIGMLSATFLSLLCGALKVFFNVHEILSTIFTNFIVFYIFRYLVSLEEVVNSSKLGTKVPIGDAIAFNLQFGLISLTLIFSIFIFIFTIVFVQKSKFGFKIKIIGSNSQAARYAGINIHRNTIKVFLISGIFAGLAGIFYYYRDLNNSNLSKSEALPNNGFDTITIVWLSQSSLAGIPFSAFFISLIRAQQKMIKISSVNPIIVEMIIGLILLLVAFFAKLSNDPKSRMRFKKVLFLDYVFTGPKNKKTVNWYNYTNNSEQSFKQNITNKTVIEKETKTKSIVLQKSFSYQKWKEKRNA